MLFGSATALGPGKVDMLEAIERTGSISAAARDMGMSYRRAWVLVDSMNKAFGHDLVVTATGGRGGGGAHVTSFGLEIHRRYREMEDKATRSVREELEGFSRMLECMGGGRDHGVKSGRNGK
ncbi:MAG: LysR family transcriptional regulator [Rhodospirillales bacterium]|nr:LysR family transcriptional regulator [Rhodospirillales bacterium]MCW8860955.1 LysR family transcriptional regulator [Rhodospirillales bacterium]MCW9039316.1 LysR family transcriptional regulator [Rhodospirillales bacterium]